MITNSSTIVLITFIAFLQALFVLGSTSPELTVRSCNSRLNGRKFTVPGVRWEPINIRLSSKAFEISGCTRGEGQKELKILNISQLKIIQEKLSTANESMKFNLSASVTYFNKDGSLGVVIEGDHHYFAKEDYCIIQANDGNMEIKYCNPTCSGIRPCIKKCCPYDETFNPIKDNCEKTEENVKWSPFLYHDEYASKPSNRSKFSSHYIYYLLSPKCPFNLEPEPHYSKVIRIGESRLEEKFSFKVLEDGSVAYITQNRKWEKQPKEYNGHFCVDAIQGYDSKIKSTGLEDEQVLFLCDDLNITQPKISTAYMASMYVAAVFLLLTCTVYLLLWDKQNVHGWTIFCLLTSMFFWYVFLGTAHLLGLISQEPESHNENEIAINLENPVNQKLNARNFANSGFFCIMNGILAHFFFLSTFSWLTCLNFDLFLTFKTLSPLEGRSKGFKKFTAFTVLCLGLPLIVVAVGLILDRQYPDRESLVLTPEYEAYCFVSLWAQGVYIYFIITVLLIINFIFVGATFYFLYSVKKLTSSVRFILVAKLSVVMGVTWIFEVVSWATSKDQDHTAWYWIVIDMYNLFQAVLLFIIFACKKSIKNQLEQKYPIFKDIFNACECTKIVSYLSTISRKSVSGGMVVSTHSADNQSNKNMINLNVFVDRENICDNNLDFDQKIPMLKSFEKSEIGTPLLSDSYEKQ